VNRRQVARNRWRNTTNAFDGFRLQLGQNSSPWQFDFFAVMPVERRLRQPDRPDKERWLYGVVGAWRRWSEFITLEPYYFILDQDGKRDTIDRKIHSMGLHGYGPIGRTGFDYDFDFAFQWGKDGPRRHAAFATYGELGYSWDHAWRPRLSVSGTYARGDRDPDDNRSQRFDRLFNAAHYMSTNDYFTWQNMISPKVRLEIRPIDKLRIDSSYGAYWLASPRDAWVAAGRRDPSGQSGDFVGQEVDVRFRYQLDPRIELEVGYAHFFPGEFARRSGPSAHSDFFYVQTTFQLYR
jgi:hypothetical protein